MKKSVFLVVLFFTMIINVTQVGAESYLVNHNGIKISKKEY